MQCADFCLERDGTRVVVSLSPDIPITLVMIMMMTILLDAPSIDCWRWLNIGCWLLVQRDECPDRARKS